MILVIDGFKKERIVLLRRIHRRGRRMAATALCAASKLGSRTVSSRESAMMPTGGLLSKSSVVLVSTHPVLSRSRQTDDSLDCFRGFRTGEKQFYSQREKPVFTTLCPSTPGSSRAQPYCSSTDTGSRVRRMASHGPNREAFRLLATSRKCTTVSNVSEGHRLPDHPVVFRGGTHR